jgi:1-acyl-sn-glycerol-3-phosphate acyltransferase
VGACVARFVLGLFIMFTSWVPSWLISVFFRNFDTKDSLLAQVDELKKSHPGRPIALAVFSGGFLEFLALRIIFSTRQDGDKLYLNLATRIPAFLIESPRLVFKRILSMVGLSKKPVSRIQLCAQELKKGNPIMMVFETTERTKSFQSPLGELEIVYLSEKVPDLLIVPVAFLWRRKRRLEEGENQKLSSKLWKNFAAPFTSPWNLFLGDPYQPKGLRKLFILLRQYSYTTIRLAPPIAINELAPKQLRRKILSHIQAEKKVILGPIYRSTRLIGESVLRSPSFQTFAQNLALEEGSTEASVYKKAQKIFYEISAKYSYFVIEWSAWFLHFIFKTIFDDVTVKEEDFEKIRDISKDGAVVYMPSHKSYVDFLLLSYILFRKEIYTPHIVAGINMNFWPMGRLFRGAGAFFIRRSFKGNVLYGEVLKRYIAELLANRISVEFFVEGKRSRSGKLLPPKYGILRMIVDSVFEGLINEKIRIVPVSLTYDRVTEEGAHMREMEGGQKVQETALGVVKSSKVLFKSYGKVHVRFAEPILLQDAFKQTIGDPAHSLETRRLGVQKIAFEVCHRINKVTPLTGYGLVCAVLLAKPGAALPRKDIETFLMLIAQDVKRLKIPVTPDLEDDFMGTCRKAIGRLVADGILSPYETPLKTRGMKIENKQRMAAHIYKNGVVHALVPYAVAGLSKGQIEKVLELRNLLEFEFFFAEKDQFIRDQKQISSEVLLPFYAFMLDDVLENICLGLGGLLKMPRMFIELDEWKSRLMKYGQSLVLEDSVLRVEGVNTQSFSAFVDMAKHKGWLKPHPSQAKLFTPTDTAKLQFELNRIKNLRPTTEDWNALRDKYIKADSPNETNSRKISPTQEPTQKP